MKRLLIMVIGLFIFIGVSHGADRSGGPLSQEAQDLLAYLKSIEGKKTLSGISSYTGLSPIEQRTGLLPALYAMDVSGHVEKGTENYDRHLEIKMNAIRDWWHRRGGVVAAHYHWGQPGHARSTAWPSRNKRLKLERLDLEKAVTPGTKEHQDVLADLKATCDYMQVLHDEKIPVIWRPMHEIDGGWFWWTDAQNPENTAKLWRMIYEYMTVERGFDNLIWIYNPAHVANKVVKESPEVQLEYRKRFYPGDEYVDMIGMDIYGSSENRDVIPWGKPEEESYTECYELMKQIAADKMVGICESGAFPNPDMLVRDNAKWVYISPWWASDDLDYLRHTYGHEYVLTLDELPNLTGHNTAPVVNILNIEEWTKLDGRRLELSGRVSDRDDNLKSVMLFNKQGPWLDIKKQESQLEEYMQSIQVLGQAVISEDGTWSFTIDKMDRGIQTFVAVAYDTKGLEARSNFVRCFVDVDNIATGKSVSATAAADEAALAVDGNMLTHWHAKEKGAQSITVDLGESQLIGAVSVFWWFAQPKSYSIDISTDGKNWETAIAIPHRRNYKDYMDVYRLDKLMKARYVRVLCNKAKNENFGYIIREIGVFPALPRESETAKDEQ